MDTGAFAFLCAWPVDLRTTDLDRHDSLLKLCLSDLAQLDLFTPPVDVGQQYPGTRA